MTEINFQATEAKINHLLHDIFMAFHMPCTFHDSHLGKAGCCGYEGRSNFCRFIRFFDTKQICRQSYLQSMDKAAKAEKPYLYFCPFGLVNITFPIFAEEENTFFITSGPLLYRPPDDRLIANILDVNYLLKPRAREIRSHLNEITVRPEKEVQSMVSLIQQALKGNALLVMNCGKEKKKDFLSFSQSLAARLQANPQPGESEAFDDFMFMLTETQKQEGEQRSKNDLEAFITQCSNYIFAVNEVNLVIYRIYVYLSLLIKISQEDGLYSSSVFNYNTIDLNFISEAKDKGSLEKLVLKFNNTFLQYYLTRQEAQNKDVVFRAIHYIRNHYSNISLQDVAAEVNLNATYFSNLFKKATGYSYSVYLNKTRIEESKKLLLENRSLADIAQSIGFSDQSYFTNVFRKFEGTTPNRWKNSHIKKEVVF